VRIVFYVVVVASAAAVTFVFSLLIWKLSMRFRLYPKIRERDVHTRPTPRLGGIAMFLGVIAAFAIASKLPVFSVLFAEPIKIWGVLGAALLIVVMGVADDLVDLDWYTKLAGQAIAAGLLAWTGTQLASLPIPGGLVITSSFYSLGLTVFVIVLVMNALNFIDGLDGLVAGVAIISNGVFFVYSYLISTGPGAQTDYFNLGSFLAAVVIGACIGFFPMNWRPARLFMGDSGALLVGLLMATSTISVTGSLDPLTIQNAGGNGVTNILGGSGTLPAFIPILLPFTVLLVPLLDFALAAFRRLGAGKSPFSADRKHLHHRLLDMGHSPFTAVLIFYSWTAVASIGVLSFLFIDWWWALIGLIVGFLVCAIVTLAPLNHRKAVEVAAQAFDPIAVEESGLVRYDRLDAAADVDADPENAPVADAAARPERVATGAIELPRRQEPR
jgi:UDP-GlcNAc:undecaprenyl-phosphate/decaprenyl-phosphate GlcNAc-1-phosphate transferase